MLLLFFSFRSHFPSLSKFLSAFHIPSSFSSFFSMLSAFSGVLPFFTLILSISLVTAPPPESLLSIVVYRPPILLYYGRWQSSACDQGYKGAPDVALSLDVWEDG